MFKSLKQNPNKISKAICLIVFCFLVCTTLPAEEQTAPETNNPITNPPETSRLARFKAAARARLVKKLTNKNGKPSKVIVLPPVDYTTLQQPEAATETIRKAIQVYDKKIDVQNVDYRMEALTLEHFRKAVIKLKSDVLLTLIMHPTNFDIYLYDARTPYQIYAHSEPIATGPQNELTKEAVQYYTKILIRRTLYRYIKNQYYELPREEYDTILRSEIPRYIASDEVLEKINRDSYSNWYATAGLGAAISAGSGDTRWWNSSLLSAGLGRRIIDDLYVELFGDMSAYNIGGASIKYIVVDKQRSFKFSFGLSAGMLFSARTFNWDVNDDIRTRTIVGGANMSVLLPIADIYLKAEGRAYYGFNNKAIILNILPGLLFVF